MHILHVLLGTDRWSKQIREALKGISLSELEKVPLVLWDELDIDGSDSAGAQWEIEQGASDALKKSQHVGFLCADRLATYYTFKAFAQQGPRDKRGCSQAGLIMIDAHPHLNKKSELLANGNVLRSLIEDNVIDPQRIILVGTRAWTQEESAFIRSNRIRCFTMRTIQEEGFNEICLLIMEQIRQWPSAYLSINIDVVDPAFSPGVSQPEPGGLTSRELIHLIHKLALLKNIGARDLVGFDPKKDPQDLTLKLCARILAEWA